MRQHLNAPYQGAVRVRAVRDEDGDVLGFFILFTQDEVNRHLAYGDLFVRPDARRRGIGRALYAEATALAKAAGRTTLVFDGLDDAGRDGTGADAGASHAFATAVGAEPVLTDQRSVLDLTTVDTERVAALSRGTGQPAGYRLARWQERCPDELIASVAAASESLYDAPFGDLDIERRAAPIAQLRRHEDEAVALGVHRYAVAAVAEDTGEVAGYSVQLVYPDSAMVQQGDTLVVAEHRGRRLGLWLKCELTLWVLRDACDVATAQTWNASANDHMLAINRQLGWRPVERWCAYQRRI